MSKKFSIEHYVTIRGIPAGVANVTVDGGCPQTEVDPGEPPMAEFTITDRKGYRADWLVEQMTDRDFEELEREVLELEYEKVRDWLS